jgi:hypothetical protein
MLAQTMPYRPGRFVIAAISLLAIPLIAMQLTDEVNWSATDFLAGGVLLVVPAVFYELAVRRPLGLVYRAAVFHALASLLLLTWANVAVGFVGEPGNAVNLLFFAVPVIAVGGAVAARLDPRGMAVSLLAAAAALLAAGGVAVLQGIDPPLQIMGLTVFFAALLVGPAHLFRVAAREPAAADSAPDGLQSSTGLRLQLRLSMLLTVYGAVLLVMMAVVEGGPGAIPLGAVVGGLAWHAIAHLRLRRLQRSSER